MEVKNKKSPLGTLNLVLYSEVIYIVSFIGVSGCPLSEVKNYRKVSIWYIEPCPLFGGYFYCVLYWSVLYQRFHCSTIAMLCVSKLRAFPSYRQPLDPRRPDKGGSTVDDYSYISTM